MVVRVVVHAALVHHIPAHHCLVEVAERQGVGDGAADALREHVLAVEVVLRPGEKLKKKLKKKIGEGG